MPFGNHIICYICNRQRIPRMCESLSRQEDFVLREIAVTRRADNGFPPAEIAADTRACHNCILTIRQEIQMLEDDPQCMRLNVLSQTRSTTCFICNRHDNVHRLSLECRVEIFIRRNIYVPEFVVTCNNHLDERQYLLQPLMEGLRYINRPYIIKGNILSSILQTLRLEVTRSEQRKYEDEHGVSDEDFKKLYSLNKADFNNLYTYCDPIPVPGGHRYISKRDLLCFLCKLGQGLSDNFLSVIFYYPSRQATSMAIATVRQSLKTRFVPQNIGFGAINREQYIQRHVPPFANRLYNPNPDNPKAIAYVDCTYLDIEKSTCFRVLRQSYSMHKSKHLVKPSMVVAPDGYILDIQGPYFSNAANNDATILIHEFNRDVNEMREWFQVGDIGILDRGYRDAIPTLNAMGLLTKMPPLLARNQLQFSTEEANETRLITKTRWIVEARNGHLKSIFKFFAGVIPTAHVQNLSDFLRIGGAIINKYFWLISMPNADAHLAEAMLDRAQEVNVVQARVDAENLRRKRGRWVQLTPAHVPLFPIIDIEYLKGLTFGTYQLYLSPSYIQDSSLRLDQIGNNQEDIVIEIDQDTNEPGFIRIRLYSRFSNAKKHQIWISFDEEYDVGNDNEEEPILGYYCTCKAGARTLGTCAHVTAIIWYLGYARHHENVRYPSLRLLNSIMNASMEEENNVNVDVIDPNNID